MESDSHQEPALPERVADETCVLPGQNAYERCHWGALEPEWTSKAWCISQGIVREFMQRDRQEVCLELCQLWPGNDGQTSICWGAWLAESFGSPGRLDTPQEGAAILVCCKMSKQGGRLAWLNTELCQELRTESKVYGLWKGTQLRTTMKILWDDARRKLEGLYHKSHEEQLGLFWPGEKEFQKGPYPSLQLPERTL